MVQTLPAVQNGFLTLGCLNNFCKVNDGLLALWAKVLQALPHSRLLLLAPRGSARDHVSAKFQQEGIAAARVQFIDRQSQLEYLQVYNRIDLCLDPWPCNGGATSLDALWMGVPIITLVGKTVVGRAGWSLLSNLGLQELAAQTPDRIRRPRGPARQRSAQAPGSARHLACPAASFAPHGRRAFRALHGTSLSADVAQMVSGVMNQKVTSASVSGCATSMGHGGLAHHS